MIICHVLQRLSLQSKCLGLDYAESQPQLVPPPLIVCLPLLLMTHLTSKMLAKYCKSAKQCAANNFQ